MELLHTKDCFLNFSGLYSDISKCETVAIGPLKGVYVEGFDLKSF